MVKRTDLGAGGAQLKGKGAARVALADLNRLLATVGKPAWTTPVLVLLGFFSSLAETLGITLVLLFVYSASGHMEESIAGSGIFGVLLNRYATSFNGSLVLAGAILVAIIARAGLSLLYNLISSRIGETISERARNRVHQQYLSVSFGYLQRFEQAQLLEVLGTESYLVASAYHSFTRLVINGSSVIVFAVFLLALSWKITLIAVVGSVVIAFGLRQFSDWARELGARSRVVTKALSEQMLVTVQGMRTIRAYGQEEIHQQRFANLSSNARETSLGSARLSSWIEPITEVGYLGMLCVIIAGADWTNTGFAVTIGAVALLYRLQPHVREFESNLLNIVHLQPQLRSLWTMLDRGDKRYPAKGHIALQGLEKDIEFRDVSFRYQLDSPQVLNGVSFHIPVGKTTALIGASGAGKTTIVNLLLRLYEPDAGEIVVDGERLNELQRVEWLSMLAIAGQDVDLIEGTVLDNIRMADSKASIEEVIAAARGAGVAEFVEPLPESYDTWVGYEGLNFSGGQRQRIGLARAILRNPKFLILDEAMSALDLGLENRIRHLIGSRMEGRTMLIITHRLETIKTADHAIWIENGRVKGEGSPERVLAEAKVELETFDREEYC